MATIQDHWSYTHFNIERVTQLDLCFLLHFSPFPVQAYGFKNYKRVGIVFQRGILILGIAMCPIWALWLNAESILLLVQQTPCVARLV